MDLSQLLNLTEAPRSGLRSLATMPERVYCGTIIAQSRCFDIWRISHVQTFLSRF